MQALSTQKIEIKSKNDKTYNENNEWNVKLVNKTINDKECIDPLCWDKNKSNDIKTSHKIIVIIV